MTTRTHRRRRPILAGLAVVFTAAAILSFETLDKLAKNVGYTAELPFWPGVHPTFYLSWLMPISIDVFGLLATVAWLTPTFDDPIRTYAKRVALGDLAGSAALNALFHGMKAAAWVIGDCVPVVIGVGAIPPVMVSLSLHLGALVMDQGIASEHDTEPDARSVMTPDTASRQAPDNGHDTTPASDLPPDTTAARQRKTTRRATKKATPNTASTAERVAKLRDKEPDITQAAVAAKLGTSVRTVQRNWGPDTAPDNVTPIHPLKEGARP